MTVGDVHALDLEATGRVLLGHLVNVGSVGQMGDREPEACYVIYSRERQVFCFRRVTYDMAGVPQAIVAAGLSAYYAQRLE